MKPETDTTKLAEKIADHLFTNGIDEQADHLVLELRGKRDLVGCDGPSYDEQRPDYCRDE